MVKKPSSLFRAQLITASIGLGLLTTTAMAQDSDAMKKKFAEKFPQAPKVLTVEKTPIKGLFELHLGGTEIVYSDESVKHIIQGTLIDTDSKSNLTQERISKLSAVPFKDLPFKDAFIIVKGKGERQMAVFEDPNCGYCKKFEKDLEKVENVTVHVFLYPILGKDSVEKSKATWCAKDKAKVFTDWMVNGQALPAIPEKCDTTAIERNIEFGKKAHITGTPTLIFTDGSRVPGAVPPEKINEMLDKAN